VGILPTTDALSPASCGGGTGLFTTTLTAIQSSTGARVTVTQS
jgi:hypothetical protein